ncbi:MAG TPA: hypothetical protein VGP93_15340 [Polyangiaceae bacterium]|jgi:hypothetical protein|nr:hypothetical protein [Polyangiaceae bacterium]
MDIPRRPSPHPSHNPDLDSARGTFREALAALRNLSTLVRARKVGPKAILDMVPDVRAACVRLSEAAQTVFDAIEPELDRDCVAELKTFLGDCCAELATELSSAEQGSMNARQRLHLEESLEKALAGLDATRALLALLECAVYEQTLPIDPVELLRQTYSGPPSGGHVRTMIGARITGDGRDVPVTKPRTLVALIACGLELLAQGGPTGTPLITVGSDAATWSVGLELSAESRGEQLSIWGYGVVPPTLHCLRAAATRLGAELVWTPEAPMMRLLGRR